MKEAPVYVNVIVKMVEKGWEYKDLSERSGISYTSLIRKLRGRSPLSLEEAGLIRSALGCDMTLDEMFARREIKA